MKSINLTLTALLLLFQIAVFSQTFPNDLTILNPKKQWQKQKGSIKAATLSVHPKGVYAECGLYLTFSDQGIPNPYFTDDSLEVVLQFKLPEGSIIHNSWLWIDDNIAEGIVMDRWTASQIYEGIVSRNNDPSILTTDPSVPNKYQIRIYPLLKGKTRKIKITYLVPMQRSKASYAAKIPADILLSSKTTCPKISVRVWPDGEWDGIASPNINGTPFVEISNNNDEVWEAELLPAAYSQTNIVEFPPVLQNGIYLNVVHDAGDDEGVYQLVVSPSLISPQLPRTRLVVAFDYQNQLNEPPLSTWLTSAKNYLKSTLSPTDSFNLVFASLFPHPYSDHWLPADDATIDQVFNDLSSSQNNYSQFVQVIGTALNFIKSSSGGYGELMVLSNTVPFTSVNTANSFVDDVIDFVGEDRITINGLTLLKTQAHNTGFLVNGVFYQSATYPLSLLSAQTGGLHATFSATAPTVEQLFQLGFSTIGPRISNFELYTTLENGICYSRYSVNSNQNQAFLLNQDYAQIGKFKGNGNFKFTMTGEVNDQIVSLTGVVNTANMVQGDTLNREAWAGLHVNALENQPYNSLIPPLVISTSISERVLSRYTAFLCLENPSTYCDECIDESLYGTDTKDLLSDSLVLVSPNPFSDQVSIHVSGIPANAGHTTLEIFDLNGRIVQVLNMQTNGDTAYTTWDGLQYNGQSAASGIYLAVVTNRLMQKAVKLVKVSP